ncbi:Flp pilus assembly protein CpaB [uncultured Hyphomonas sp.]|uniref:Flp pilus assembly protein CpaB n=1 Tax=uncultured Hyphomonas sp. TaxID=225298 RepID=UPI002AAA8314|nr:Flp pilus assembly protein CpaB [uncultured Hyphomonas sp.]
MSPMRLIILIGAAAAAIAAAFLVRGLTQPQTVTQTVTEQQTVLQTKEVSETHVLVAKRNLIVGDLLSPDDFEWAPWPEKNLVEGYQTEEDNADAINELSGSVVRIPIYAEEPILPQKLVMKGETGFMAALLKPGMRAISVEISTESASGGFILPDDRVDVILTYQGQVAMAEAVLDRPVTETILKNVRVLAIDQVFYQGESESASQIGNTATLEVNPNEAELIAHAQRLGTLSLSLRPWSDAGDTGSRGARTDLLRGGSPGNSVTIYRNGRATAGPGGS